MPAAPHGDRLWIVEAQNHAHVEGNALLVNKASEIRKIPVPSSDPNDPLNFRAWEKYAVVFCCCWFSIMGLSIASGLGPILNVFFGMYIPQGYTPDGVVFLVTLPTLHRPSNYLILPLALEYGRRSVFLAPMVILLGSTIAAAVQNSYNGHLASRIIQGMATGASESLLPLMLTEVTFLHERSRIFGLYWMIQNALSLDGQLVITDEFGVTRIIPDSEAQDYLEHMERSGMTAPGADHAGAATQRMPYLHRIRPWSTPHPQPGRVILLSWKHKACYRAAASTSLSTISSP
ncbi:hypothetical protein ACHAQH_004909 [Verticillium albo-atrum]